MISQACRSETVDQSDRGTGLVALHNAPLVTPTGANAPIVWPTTCVAEPLNSGGGEKFQITG